MKTEDPLIGLLLPALAADLSGLPPALILTGSLDLFRDEDIAFAQRLWRSGGAVGLHIYAGAVHGSTSCPEG